MAWERHAEPQDDTLELGPESGRTAEGAAVEAAEPLPEHVTKPYVNPSRALFQQPRKAQRQLLQIPFNKRHLACTVSNR